MSLPLVNSAEGGTNTTTVTAGNSGGSSGNAFSTPVIGTNMTLTFDNSHAAHGSLAYKFALTSTATAITYLPWTTTEWGSAIQHVYGRVYYWNSALPTNSVRIVAFFNGATLLGSLFVNSGSGTMQFRSAADAAIGTPSSALTLSAWNRIEWDIFCGASGTATGTIKVYTGDSLTPLATNGDLGANAFGTSAGVDNIRFGINTAAFSSTSGAGFWLDSINVNPTGLPGPLVPSIVLNNYQFIKAADGMSTTEKIR